MQKQQNTTVIHIGTFDGFLDQIKGPAYTFQMSQSGQHFRNWYLVLSGFNESDHAIRLTIHIGEAFMGDETTGLKVIENLNKATEKANARLSEKGITVLDGYVGGSEEKIIGTL